ncbi:hypothetical protein C2S51_010261 [Perilla frutescens var. frutescens]|nr:hypothetical protein C2S51_010261 [Perilla frutescens var. frutescens]
MFPIFTINSENCIALSIPLHELERFLILGDENLVGIQEALDAQQILEVGVVEGCRRDEVQREEVLIAARLRAPRTQLDGVGLIQGEIWP